MSAPWQTGLNFNTKPFLAAVSSGFFGSSGLHWLSSIGSAAIKITFAAVRIQYIELFMVIV
jgi:hypothetical protein